MMEWFPWAIAAIAMFLLFHIYIYIWVHVFLFFLEMVVDIIGGKIQK